MSLGIPKDSLTNSGRLSIAPCKCPFVATTKSANMTKSFDELICTSFHLLHIVLCGIIARSKTLGANIPVDSAELDKLTETSPVQSTKGL